MQEVTTRAFIGLGSNVGDREGFIDEALGALQQDRIEILQVSSLYETEPVGPAQGDFINCVCEIATDLKAVELLRLLKQIERDVGRIPGQRWGPREIDLDLLLHGDQTVDDESFTVPHPELTKRAFVVVPLLEIAPDLVLPDGRKLKDAAEPDHHRVTRLQPS